MFWAELPAQCQQFLRSSWFFPPVFSDEKTQAAIDPATYSLTLSNNSDLALEISGSDSDNIGIMKDTVVVNTASPSGYDFYISFAF